MKRSRCSLAFASPSGPVSVRSSTGMNRASSSATTSFARKAVFSFAWQTAHVMPVKLRRSFFPAAFASASAAARSVRQTLASAAPAIP